MRALWGDALWAAVSEHAVDYTLLRRATLLEVSTRDGRTAECAVRLDPLPPAVMARELTFRAHVPWDGVRVSLAAREPGEGAPVDSRLKQGTLTWTAPVHDGIHFVLRAG